METNATIERLIAALPEPKRPRRCVRNPEAAALVLAALAKGYGVSDACKIAGLTRMQYAAWKRSDPDFAAAANAAVAEGNIAITRARRVRANSAA